MSLSVAFATESGWWSESAHAIVSTYADMIGSTNNLIEDKKDRSIVNSYCTFEVNLRSTFAFGSQKKMSKSMFGIELVLSLIEEHQKTLCHECHYCWQHCTDTFSAL